jgi:subtilisin
MTDLAETKTARHRPKLTWRLLDQDDARLRLSADGQPITLSWAWGGATGRGVQVCVVDSGVEPGHPLVGALRSSSVVVRTDDGYAVRDTDPEDTYGHGTACAGVIRRTAPECDIHSLRVLGERGAGTGDSLLTGLRWAVEQDFDVINLSLSTTRTHFVADLREIVDDAYFRRSVIVASAHNTPVESFPWRFSSVISVGSHQDEDDPELYLYNPAPPVEFFAPGQNVEVPWLGGGVIRATGNSFATPFMAGLCARILSKHPRLTTFQLKTVLYLSAANIRVDTGGAL